MGELKQRVQAVIREKQLTSLLNRTKWERLQKSVIEELAFPPAYQIKYVLENRPYPESFEQDVWYWGDWEEGLEPFYHIEWIRVRPRYVKKRGKISEGEIIDITEEFIRLLRKWRIPFVVKKESIYIYGYVKHADVFYVDCHKE
ncbi:hypothetical protein MK805_03365 [Shimazuella sp. AN120528]|uniref:DUF6678 family protein n=1 Tax=Shimazuella soli TaxID=1892854 RepID=UPI001F0E0DD2|nr:DUF6678 family protein [Shimazuella soli]MCH5584002.1 hypothetical protein [Shimazuella soli]